MQNPVFIPGPTNMPEALRKAVDVPTMDHRSAAFAEVLTPALEGVRRVVKAATAAVFVFPSTGTGGWEIAITNTLSPGDRILAARHGMFSHRWIDLCQRHGLDVQIVEEEWGAGLPAEAYLEILSADRDHRIKAVLATHNETATGVVSDIAAVRRALDKARHPALLMVDGVSSIGSMDFRFDDWGVDIAVTGSQKGFMLPPGLAITVHSARAMKVAETARLARCFFDIRDMGRTNAAGLYPYTPPVGLICGLKLACDYLLDEGLEAVFARHARIANGVRAAAAAWGLPLGARSPDLYSQTVTAVRTPTGFNATDIVTRAATVYDTAFGTGLGELAGKVFRFGHLGRMSDLTALSGLAVLEMCMVDLGLPIRLGSGVAAAQEVYRSTAAAQIQRAA
ncbi:L-aspartate--glyoxylate aminotransferase BhcA [Neotabrizicola sp. sgz301269]|uniref:L-aspartate--glyoxylate aminotransferase BhcA n=1 Tax=Neotabrizicola sp. sgz301269 TaxID=3276282 RepID=UPI00377028E6